MVPSETPFFIDNSAKENSSIFQNLAELNSPSRLGESTAEMAYKTAKFGADDEIVSDLYHDDSLDTLESN